MTIFKKELTRKSAVLIILTAAVILAAIVLAVSTPGDALSDTPSRIRYLAALGWEADAASEEVREVLLPREFDGVMADYIQLQRDSGYDMEKYTGCYCTLATYTVVNYPTGDKNVLACLFIYKGKVIGGDIHSTAIDGFMHALR